MDLMETPNRNRNAHPPKGLNVGQYYLHGPNETLFFGANYSFQRALIRKGLRPYLSFRFGQKVLVLSGIVQLAEEPFRSMFHLIDFDPNRESHFHRKRNYCPQCEAHSVRESDDFCHQCFVYYGEDEKL